MTRLHQFSKDGLDCFGRTVMESLLHDRAAAQDKELWAKERLAEITRARGTWHLYREPKSGITIAIKTPRPRLECKLLADPVDGFGRPYEHLGVINMPSINPRLFYKVADSERVPIGCAYRWAVVLGHNFEHVPK